MPFSFHPECTIPFDDNSLELVYVSHGLQQLDDQTIVRFLSEAHRVVAWDGALVLKFPDLDQHNAWNQSELEALLMQLGFRILSFETSAIARQFHWVPGVNNMDSISTYCLAVPTAERMQSEGNLT